MILHKFLIICVSYFFCLLAFANETETNQPIHVTSDSFSQNYKTGVSFYEGHVKVDQGTTHLIADRLKTQKNKKHTLEEIIAYGLQNLAEYITFPKEGDPVLHAKAKLIKFYPVKSLVILQGNVTVKQGDNSFNGPIIFYNTKDQIVTSPASKDGNATIIIEPKKINL